MFTITKKSIEWGGRTLTLETGRVARQADGAVLATYGDTTVLATVVGAKQADPKFDFFPLTVHYQEKFYAAGRVPGGYFKREGRPTEKETLTSRLIDRPIRPLFAKGFKNEVLVVAQVLSHDLENDPDVVSMIAVSAALTVSGIPFLGPIGAARVGHINGEFVLNPTIDQMPDSKLDLVMAGTADAVMMVESEAKELPEDVMLGAVVFGHKAAKDAINFIIDFAELSAKEPWDFTAADNSGHAGKVRALVEADVVAAYKERLKQVRQEKLAAAKAKAIEALCAEGDENALDKNVVSGLFKTIESDIVRGGILETGERIDG
ncbi:MAG: polyribonucleotide nucleotidyltransferase, partial [Amphiplicatus sp.]